MGLMGDPQRPSLLIPVNAPMNAPTNPNQDAPVVLAEDDPEDQSFFKEIYDEMQLPNPLVVLPDGEHLINYVTGQPPYQNAQPPCLIVMDWFMPKLQGVELVQCLRQTEAAREIPIVVITGASPVEPIEGIINACLLKSGNYDRFKQELELIVSRYVPHHLPAEG